MHDHLTHYITRHKNLIDKELQQHLHKLSVPNQLKESMLYSVEAGGKRLRPILMMASFESFQNGVEKVLTTACALEMIHTYSLIHDDLPAMDDDDLRRGKPTNHKVFDEATAILAGDGLLTYSFEIVANDPMLSEHEKVEIIKLLAQASGPSGMVAGQILDMKSEDQSISLEALDQIHRLKTGELISFAVHAGAYLGQATKEQLEYLRTFSTYLGLIFQVQDDILDVVGDPDKLGKPLGSDEGNQKNTYPKLLGLEGARQKKEDYIQKATHALRKAHAEESYLLVLTEYLANRDH